MKPPYIQKRESELNRIIAQAKKAIKRSPEGFLQITRSHGTVQYYQILGNRAQRTYLGKKDLPLAKALAQKSYDQQVLRSAEQELKAWQLLSKHFPAKTAEEVYTTLSPARQNLVTPIRPTDKNYRKQWEAQPYESGYFKPDTPVYMTDKGERVRSKSEQLIANMLYRLGIPYRYEYPIAVFVNGQKRTWRPDFTLLDIPNRKEYYLEHFGMLGEENYTKNALGKMRIYEENGIFEGNNIIYSFESNEVPLDIQYLERKVRRSLGL